MAAGTPARRERAAAAAKKPVVPVKRMKVMATRLGYYGEKRRRLNDKFIYTAELDEAGEPKLPSWMVEQPKTAALQETGAQDALNAEIKAQLEVKHSSGGDDDQGQEEEL